MASFSRLFVLALLFALGAGCAWGPDRGHFMDAMAPYRPTGVQVERPRPARGVASLPPAQADLLRAPLQAELDKWGAGAAPPLRVVPEVLELHAPRARDALDTFIRGRDDARVSFRLALECPQPDAYTVRVPTGETNWMGRPRHRRETRWRTVYEECGELFWSTASETAGLEAIIDQAAAQSGAALVRLMSDRKDDWVNRSAADERFLLSSSALTLRPGEIVLADDELFLLRLGVGLSRRVELDAALGGFAVPAAGAVPVPPLGIAGAAGGALVAALDLGVKVRLVNEDSRWPGIAASYDLLDLFGAALGGAAFVGYGVAGVAAGGVLNIQLNVFQLDVNKHFGNHLQLGGDLLWVDNHHLLPQGVAFALAAGSWTGGGVSGGAATLPEIPDALFPVFNFEWAFYPWFRFIQELSPGFQWNKRFGATGVRLVLSLDEDGRWLAWSRIRCKVDLALLEAHGGSQWEALPWLGVGLYYFP